MGFPRDIAGAAVVGIVIGLVLARTCLKPQARENIEVTWTWRRVPDIRVVHWWTIVGRLTIISTIVAGLEVVMAVPAHAIEEFVAKVVAGNAVLA